MITTIVLNWLTEIVRVLFNSDHKRLYFVFRVMAALSDVYYGRVKHPWGVLIDELPTTPKEDQIKLQKKKCVEVLCVQNEQEIYSYP